MSRRVALFGLILATVLPDVVAAPLQNVSGQGVRAVSAADIGQWGLALCSVLILFFICIWALRKLQGFTAGGTEKLKIVGGLAVGMREKIVVLEVGKKQLVLSVTPGRIETLLVLEEDDCLKRDSAAADIGENAFAQKLRQAMKGRSDA